MNGKENVSKDNTIEIKLKVLDIVKDNISDMRKTISMIDSKAGILLGFYFLVLFEVIKILKKSLAFSSFLAIIFFVLSFVYVIKTFILKRDIRLYPNLENYLGHDGKLEYEGQEGYVMHLYGHYKIIEKTFENLIRERRNYLIYSIILFCIGVVITCFVYFMPDVLIYIM